MILDPSQLKPAETQYYLQHLVAPRPICFASTVNAAGEVNLSPFSFFNLFSSNPPIVIFSPARRVRDNTTKHSLENVKEVPEVVINMVSYEMVQQTSLASCEYPRGVDEFTKAGFTATPATLVKPPMVKEAPASLECKVLEIKSLGDQGGAGQLIICEVLRVHINDRFLDAEKKIDQAALDLVARMGGDWYARAFAPSMFIVPKPNTKLGIGFDKLPASLLNSKVLTGNHLGRLANVHEFPVVNPGFTDPEVSRIIQYFSLNPEDMENEIHRRAAQLLDEGKVDEAWQVLLSASPLDY